MFSIEMESHKYFCQGWRGTMILPISASLVAWMTGTCHHMEKFYGDLTKLDLGDKKPEV
jgi:hypothetical protein